MRTPLGLDDPPGSAYLGQAMLRRLITLLALLSGLAATGAPAQAMVYSAAAAGVELAAGAEKPCKGESCDCVHANRRAIGTVHAAKPSQPVCVVTVTIPTVQLGIDRAAE